MREFAGAALALVIGLTFSARLRAQEPPPRIGPFVVDLHGTFRCSPPIRFSWLTAGASLLPNCQAWVPESTSAHTSIC